MRCYLVLVGTLFGVTAALAQQTGPNVVPNGAINGAVRRAFQFPVIPPPGPIKTTFRAPLVANRATINLLKPAPICAIPLLEAKGTPTHDHINMRAPDTQIDPRMARAPAVPACPSAKP
jgi:hypothetical protein